MLSLELTAYNSSDLSLQNTGLGNVMYQLSFQYSICKKYDLMSNYNLCKKFIEKIQVLGLQNYNIFRNFINNDSEISRDIILKETNYCLYDEKLINEILKQKDKNILIKDSYLQSHKYFHDFKEDIQNLFGPDEEFLKSIKNKYPKLFDIKQTNICIQMRLKWNSGDNMGLDVHFILECLKYFKNNGLLKENINLWVFSDNINKAKNILLSLDENYNIVYVNDNIYDYEDLWLMSLIDNHIVSFSTFSWWGAYLNKNTNKKVLYSSDYYYTFYKNILRRDGSYEKVMNNIYPNDWICIDKKYITL
jgi:hypothetical protein